MSESRFGSNAGVSGDETSYEADVKSATDEDDRLGAADEPSDLSYDPAGTSRAADVAAGYDDDDRGVDERVADDDQVMDDDALAEDETVVDGGPVGDVRRGD
jgi:hypothetical protein